MNAAGNHRTKYIGNNLENPIARQCLGLIV